MTSLTVLAGHRSSGTDVAQAAALAIADELTGHEFEVRDTEGSRCLKVDNLPGIFCEILVSADGLVELECRPRESSQADPAWTAEVVLRLLGADALVQPATMPAGLFSFKSVVGQMLDDHGMDVAVKVYQRDFEVYSLIHVTNPAHPGRGFARVADDGLVLWQCQIREQPGDATAPDPADIARTVAQALTTGTTGKPQQDERRRGHLATVLPLASPQQG
jgi:hypothetical protein